MSVLKNLSNAELHLEHNKNNLKDVQKFGFLEVTYIIKSYKKSGFYVLLYKDVYFLK